MQERIAGCEAQLQQLDGQVVSLKGEFESKKGLEIELKNSLAKAEATLTAASSLLGKLSGEKSRWEAQVSLGNVPDHPISQSTPKFVRKQCVLCEKILAVLVLHTNYMMLHSTAQRLSRAL